jgi:hypothetical protein
MEFPPGAPAPFVPAWFRDKALRHLSGSELKVLLVYIFRANKRGEAFPSIGGLCVDTGLGVNAVKGARSSLVAKGLFAEIEQERHGGKFGRKAFRLGWK